VAACAKTRRALQQTVAKSRVTRWGLAVRRRRDLAEKGWAPLRYWVTWWAMLLLADIVFYVLLTPLWLGWRALAWLAELRSRAARR
jgi:hypothetical protein